METIFVTGGSGFIGSNYLNHFVPIYPNTLFLNLDALTYASESSNVTVTDEANYEFVQADICDRKRISELFRKYQPTGVVHFAAETHVDKSIQDPKKFIETNVAGTQNLLQLSIEYKVERFHQISTDEVYGDLKEGDLAFTEESPLAPNNPYSASKASADLLVRAYYKTYGLNAVITRSSNNFGPNQDDTKLIPLFLKKLRNGEKVPLYGNGENIRDWLYVVDHVKAIDLVYQKARPGSVFNIGGSQELSNLDLVKKLLVLTGRDQEAIEYVSDRLGHDFRYAINAEKIKNELGWESSTTLDEGLRKLIA